MLTDIPSLEKGKEILKSIDTFNDNVGKIFEFIKNVIYLVSHPALLFKYTSAILGIVCVIVVCVGLILYASGYKKGGLWAQGAVFIYVVMKMIGMVL